MLTYEDTLAQLLAWMDQPVYVTVVPVVKPLLQVAQIFGTLTQGKDLSEAARAKLGTDEALFFDLGPDFNGHHSCFVIPRDHFDAAQMPDEDTLAITLRGCYLTVARDIF